MSKSENVRKFRFCLLFGLCALFVREVWAQPGGGSPERMFGMFDRDRNGLLEGEELARIRGPLKESLEQMEVDVRRGVNVKEFSDAFEEMRRGFEERGGFRGRDRRGDSDRRSRGRSFDGSNREDASRDRRREDRASGNDRRSASLSRTTTSSGTKGPVAKGTALTPRPRVTVDLPAKFEEGDTDQDGQIGFYEWRAWKRGSTSEFFNLDHNQDGFLTPRELQLGPVVSETPIMIATEQVPRATPMQQPVASPQPAVAATPVEPVNLDSPAGRRAQSMFRLLDKDRNGSIDLEEWSRSSRLKPMFEAAGIDLKAPMPKDVFLSHYVRLSESNS